MYAKYQCLNCITKHSMGLLEKAYSEHNLDDPKIQKEIFENYIKLIQTVAETAVWGKKPVELSLPVYDKLYEIFGKQDFYMAEKSTSNRLLLEMYDDLLQHCINSPDPIEEALKISALGNFIDYGVKNSFGELEWELQNLVKTKTLSINHTKNFIKDLKEARSLLVIHDNAGEIVLDKVLIRIIKKIYPKLVVYSAVRSEPVINDVTMTDAQEINLKEVSIVIESGSKYPGTLLDNVNVAFKNIFDNADVILSKGQGNFEGLNGVEKNIYFNFMAKCHPVANAVGVKVGDVVFGKIKAHF